MHDELKVMEDVCHKQQVLTHYHTKGGVDAVDFDIKQFVHENEIKTLADKLFGFSPGYRSYQFHDYFAQQRCFIYKP